MKDFENSQKLLVSSRKFNKLASLGNILHPFGHNELTSNYSRLTTKTLGFTMAEILLSLTIIGVVAAITLPSLTGNINERTWNTQRKALYSRMSQAISLMPALNGYGTLNETTDNAAETFITSGLSKVLKINNICSSNLEDCGIGTSYTDMKGSKKTLPTTLYGLNEWFSHISYQERSYSTKNSNAVAFETQNGENIVAYYNPTCRTEYINEDKFTHLGNAYGFPESTMCVNFIYDLNGKKGPNTVGKDIGAITVFNATDSIVVAPIPASNSNVDTTATNWQTAVQACTNADSESRMPNIYELSSMSINKDFVNLESETDLWASTAYNAERVWTIHMSYGRRCSLLKTFTGHVRCVKR